MLLTLKWMDNLQQIEHHQKICHLFFVFNLTCCKFVALKEKSLSLTLVQNHYNKQTKHSLQSFPCTSPEHRPHLGKTKIFLIIFRQILPKILLAAHIFGNKIMNNLKKLIGNKSLNTKVPSRTISQNYPPTASWETLGMGQNASQQPNIYLFLPLEKSSLINLHHCYCIIFFEIQALCTPC